MPTNIMNNVERLVADRGIARDELIASLENATLEAGRRVLGPEHRLEAQVDARAGHVVLERVFTVVTTVQHPERELAAADVASWGIDTTVGEELCFEVHFQDGSDAEAKFMADHYGADVALSEETRRAIQRLATQATREALEHALAEAPRGPSAPVASSSVASPRGGDEQALLDAIREWVPEVEDGLVRIEGIARGMGSFCKVAVSGTHDCDPLGACWGSRNTRSAGIEKQVGEPVQFIQFDTQEPSARIYGALRHPSMDQLRPWGGRVTVEIHGDDAVVVVPDPAARELVQQHGNIALASALIGRRIAVTAPR